MIAAFEDNILGVRYPGQRKGIASAGDNGAGEGEAVSHQHRCRTVDGFRLGVVAQTVGILVVRKAKLGHGEVEIRVAVHLDPQGAHNGVPVFGIQSFHLHIADKLHVGSIDSVGHACGGHVPVALFVDQHRIQIASGGDIKAFRRVSFRNRLRSRGIEYAAADRDGSIFCGCFSHQLVCPVGILQGPVPILDSQVVKALFLCVLRIGNDSVMDIQLLPAGNCQCFQRNGNLILDAEALSGSQAAQSNREALPVCVESRRQGLGCS